MTEPMPLRAWLRREMLTGALANALLSALAFLAVFERPATAIPVWGMGQLAFDFAVQSFGVAFMSTLVPGLMAGKALKSGRIAPLPGHRSLPLAPRALAVGVVVALAGGVVCAVVLHLAGIMRMGWPQALAVKTAYGAALGVLVIVLTLPLALRKK